MTSQEHLRGVGLRVESGESACRGAEVETPFCTHVLEQVNHLSVTFIKYIGVSRYRFIKSQC